MRPFRLSDRVRSFGPALQGLAALLRSEHNARIHAAATVVVAVAGLVLDIGRSEWLAIVLVVALVWVAEALNSALEAVADAVTLERDPRIGRAKDIAAGAVLLAAIAALVVAAIVFGPRIAGAEEGGAVGRRVQASDMFLSQR